MTRPTGALTGIRVLDFSIWMLGPGATQVLGDFGADIVKIEPVGGEPGRGLGMGHPLHSGVSTRFLSRNRNKRSLCLDLGSETGRRIASALMSEADVVVQNFRPGVAERLGIGYADATAARPDIVYASGSGYGLQGPLAHLGGQDRAAQAMSGFLSANGDPGQTPTAVRAPIMDFAGAMILAQGILVALLARERTGEGQRVDLALLDAAIAANTEHLTTYLNTGRLIQQSYDPLMRCYRTADGAVQVVTVFARSQNPMRELAVAIGREGLADDPRFATADARDAHELELTESIAAVMAERTTEEWLEVFEAHGIIAAPVNTYADLVGHPQVQANGIIASTHHPVLGDVSLVDQPLRLSATPASIRMAPPLPGEHTAELLLEAGFDQADISAWFGQGVIA